jgi:hypothetical protein
VRFSKKDWLPSGFLPSGIEFNLSPARRGFKKRAGYDRAALLGKRRLMK